MFGVARPCRQSLGPAGHRAWMAHLCGLCLQLRDRGGQPARLTTNVDAVVLSVLVDALRAEPLATRTAGPCVLRGLRRAEVVAPEQPAVLHAAAVSLTMAGVKIADHVADGDGLLAHVPAPARSVGDRWRELGEALGEAAASPSGELAAAVARSTRRERLGVPDGVLDGAARFGWFAEPTEDAAATAFAHTAVLAGRPDDEVALGRLGRAFGRIVYLLDAVEDESDDLAAERFNALVASFPSHERAAGAAALFRAAHGELRAGFEAIAWERADLARGVVVEALWRAGRHRFGPDRLGGPSAEDTAGSSCRSGAALVGSAAIVTLLPLDGFGRRRLRRRRRRHDDDGVLCGFCCCDCDCCDCDCDCCDCDCCDCD